MKNPVLFLVSLVLLTSSCGHSYYFPNMQNVPLFRQANDNMFVISSGSGFDDGSTMLDIQGAYALSNHFEVTGGYFSSEQEGNNNPSTDYNKGSMFKIGAGVYQPLGKIGSFDLMSGYGNGKQFHKYNTNTYDWSGYETSEPILETGTANLRYNQFFIQSSLGLTSKVIDVAFSARMTNMKYYDVQSRIEGHGDEYNTLQGLSRTNCWWFEPAVTVRLGYSPIKLQLQVILSRSLQEIAPSSTNLCANLGLVFTIPPSKKTVVAANL